jgi:hypothetical protein
MKKLIGSVSLAVVMGCVLALANANDDTNTNPNTNNGTSDMSSQTGMVHQEPGTASDSNVNSDTSAPYANGDSSNPSNAGNPGNMKSQNTTQSTTTTSTSKTAMNKKSCTDDNGKVILKGHTGYKACVKAQKKAQMGGTAANPSSDSYHPDDSSNTMNNQ